MIRISLLVLAFIASFHTSFAKNIFSDNQKDLKKIENYLNGIKNLSADFIQTSQSGVVKGKFMLSRPGKMRVEYEDQPKILIVVNGSVLSYHDLELDEISRLATNTTPASFLTRKNISFSAKDVTLTDFKKDNEFTSVAVIKKNRPEAGEFRLVFKNDPFGFVKMEVKDDFEQTTSISLINTTFPERLSNRLFIIKNKNLPL
jgi:outer membrane lipoprotein-sorting protein